MPKKGEVPDQDDLPAKILVAILILVIIVGVFSIAVTVISPGGAAVQSPRPSQGEISITLLPPPSENPVGASP